MATLDVQGQLEDLAARLEAMETAFTGQGETGREGGEGREGEKGEAGREGEAGAEVDKSGNVTENNAPEIDKEGNVTPANSETKLEKKGGITKKNLKTEAEKEGIGGGIADYRITVEIVKAAEILPKVMTKFRWENIETGALSVGGVLKITSITDKEGKAFVGKLNPDPFVGSVGYIGFAMGGGNETIGWVHSIEGNFEISVWTEEKHTIQETRSFAVNLIKLP